MSRLERFRSAQDARDDGFASALREIHAGGKRGHWIWYVFPQLAGLGMSPRAQFYALDGEDETVEYLQDPVLRSRLLTIARAVATQLRAGTPLLALMGSAIDAKKIVSSLTLFGHVAKKLRSAKSGIDDDSLADVADEVLAAAAREGYPPCAFTLEHLRRPT
jgi:uncharacterized protein (DUF1810 family)